MEEHLHWLTEQYAEGYSADELWSLLENRLDGSRPETWRVWRAWVAKPY